MLALTAEEKGLSLTCVPDPGVALDVVGDPARLRQVLMNLVSNAVKFTDRGEVTVIAAVEAEAEGRVKVRIEVRDTGIGIGPEMRETALQAVLAGRRVGDAQARRVGAGPGDLPRAGGADGGRHRRRERARRRVDVLVQRMDSSALRSWRRARNRPARRRPRGRAKPAPTGGPSGCCSSRTRP